MSPKQKKLAAKAPPPNKLDEKDFKVLREEKAKGRGMGLQDESVQPGKVKPVKASLGVLALGALGAMGAKKLMKKKDKVMDPGGFPKKMLPINLVEMYKKATGKKMGGSMMKKYSKGGGADSGRIGEMKSKLAVALDKAAGGFRKARGKVSPRTYDKITERQNTYTLAQSMKDKDRLTDRDIKKASSLVKGKMGGGMMKARRGRIVDDQKRDKRNPNRKPSTKIFDKIGDILKTPYYIRGGKKEKKMGGGMIAPSQRPGYSKGTMVKARGCKLGRTRPTKIT